MFNENDDDEDEEETCIGRSGREEYRERGSGSTLQLSESRDGGGNNTHTKECV